MTRRTFFTSLATAVLFRKLPKPEVFPATLVGGVDPSYWSAENGIKSDTRITTGYMRYGKRYFIDPFTGEEKAYESIGALTFYKVQRPQ